MSVHEFYLWLRCFVDKGGGGASEFKATCVYGEPIIDCTMHVWWGASRLCVNLIIC